MNKMFLGVLSGCLLGATVGVFAHNNNNSDKPVSFNLNAVRQMVCWTPPQTDFRSGTGFTISGNRLITAAHVVRDNNATCYDLARRSKLILSRIDSDNDVALMRYEKPHQGEVLRLRCGHFDAGTYYTFGFNEQVTFSELYSSGTTAPRTYRYGEGNRRQYGGGLVIVHGKIRDGMSGGPIMRHDGTAVGVVVAGADESDTGLIRNLDDTFICVKAR